MDRMFGPMFRLEWLSACRRGRHFRFRTLYGFFVAAEAAFFLLSWYNNTFLYSRQGAPAPEVSAHLVWSYLPLFAAQQFLLILLAAPALAAGSITEEKSRGTLALVLTTDLTAGEIILGKWLGQTAQVLTLSAPAWPVLLVLAAAAGLAPLDIVQALLASVLLAMALTAGAILTSVWARRTTAAVLGLYVLLGAALVLAWSVGLVFDARIKAGLAALSLLAFTSVCLALASWRLRPAHAVQLTGARKRRRFWFQRPAVSEMPVRWKERYIGELGLLTPLRRVPLAARLLAVMGVSLLVTGLTHERVWTWHLHGFAFMVACAAFVGIRASGIIAGERERQTWDSLLITPLGAKQLVRGKLWGIIDSAKPYLVAYLVPAMVWPLIWAVMQAADNPDAMFTISAFAAWSVVTMLLFWIGAWGLLYFVGAYGISCSARSSSTWQSLFKTGSGAALAVFQRLVIFGVPSAAAVYAVCGIGAWLELWVAALILVPLLPIFAEAEALLEQAQQHIQGEHADGRIPLPSPLPPFTIDSVCTPHRPRSATFSTPPFSSGS